MKVESKFVIEGQICEKVFESDQIVIYKDKDDSVYIESKDTGNVIVRMDINCEMSQGTGFVDSLTFLDFSNEN